MSEHSESSAQARADLRSTIERLERENAELKSSLPRDINEAWIQRNTWKLKALELEAEVQRLANENEILVDDDSERVVQVSRLVASNEGLKRENAELLEYIDEAKKALGDRRVSGEPLRTSIVDLLDGLAEIKAERDGTEAVNAHLAEIIRDLRRKLAEAGVEGSPPPGDVGTIPRLVQRWHEALTERDSLRAEVERLTMLVEQRGEACDILERYRKNWEDSFYSERRRVSVLEGALKAFRFDPTDDGRFSSVVSRAHIDAINAALSTPHITGNPVTPECGERSRIEKLKGLLGRAKSGTAEHAFDCSAKDGFDGDCDCNADLELMAEVSAALAEAAPAQTKRDALFERWGGMGELPDSVLAALEAPARDGERQAGEICFSELRAADLERQAEWDRDGKIDLAYRGNELAGEVGEACNIIKKLERERLGIGGSRSTFAALAAELADVIICADLVAMQAEIDLGAAVRSKFNATSEKLGLATRLGITEPKVKP